MRIQFDRGTLVVDQIVEGAERAVLDGAAWDPELAAWRLPASRWAELRVRLADVGVRNPSDKVAPGQLEAAWKLPELRWYQRSAIGAWRAAGERGVIALPTGTGKTLTAIGAIAALGVATLVLVPTRVLLDQWARALGEAWPFPIGRLGDGDHVVAPITVATYASAIGWAPRIGDAFGLVVVDEAHHVGAWCPREVFDMVVAPARLGLTATPPEPGGALDAAVGPVVYALGIADLIGDALAAFDLETVRAQLDAGERETYRTRRGQFNTAYARFARGRPGASWREFVAHASTSRDGRAALAAWRASRAVLAFPQAKRAAVKALLARHAGERMLIFTSDNATAYAIARELLVNPVTCEIGRRERAEMLRRFRSGEAPVLVSAQVLDEGLDVPEADVAIVVGGTASARRHVQRIGRVLRSRLGKRARVYELATDAELGTVAQRRRGLGHRETARREVVS
ncbi:MAG: DEAD/DEAH box helicase family protein [Kofleriaceae bacterium]